MKKHISRLLSLVLVLVMVLGMIPMAAAATADEVNPTASASNAMLGEGNTAVDVPITIRPDTPAGYSVSYDWGSYGQYITSGSGASVVVSCQSAGEKSFSCTLTYTNTTDSTDTFQKTVTATFTVSEYTAPADNYAITLSETALALDPGGHETLTATVTNNGTPVADAEVEWSKTGSSKISVVGGAVLVDEDATSDDTATITATYEGATATCAVTVNDTTAQYTVTISPSSLEVDVNGVKGIPAVTVKDSNGTTLDSSAYTVVWSSADERIAKIGYADTAVSGVAAGATTITATVKIGGETIGTATCSVTVGGGAIYCAAATKPASSSGTTITLTPALEGVPSGSVDYKYTLGATRGSVTLRNATGGFAAGTTCTVACTGIGGAVVKIEAYDKTSGDKIATGETTVSFYGTNNVEVTMKEGLTTMTFNNASHITESGSLASKLLTGYYGTSVYDSNDVMRFSALTASEGTLDGNNYSPTTMSASVSGLDFVTFTVGTTGVAEFTYEIFAGEILLSRGVATIIYDGKLGSIEYSIDYNEYVTFAESDFAKFWTASGKKTDLDYVEFTITGSYPAYGTLYTSTTQTGDSYKAQSYHKFYYGTYTSGTYNKDLGSATYRPLKTKTSAYDVTIPFVAYGDEYSTSNTGDKITGSVIIHMNPASNVITPRGVYMGTEYDKTNDLTYVDQMNTIYEQKSGRVLGQVTFVLPDPEKATLFEKIPTSGQVAQGTQLTSGKTLYVSAPSSSTSSAYTLLKNVALVPAAGYSGEFTLTFVGKDSAGNNPQTCTITFKVETKNDSDYFTDVTPTSYSWAADSVDFLYLEGTAKGSNGKYNPAANITRGDFMLMLYRAFLEPSYGDMKVTSNFPDVVKGSDSYSQETYQAVGVAKYLGIAKGTDGKYNPKSNITREEAMVLIYRTMDVMDRDLRYSTTTKATSFKDYSKISTWATAAISDLVSHGVIKGNNNNIDPKSNITRAEMACILHRVITY